MSLVFDARQELQGPGVHALIVGVSSYPHLPGGGGSPAPEAFGMKSLASTALAAHAVYRWILNRKDHLPAQLATVRMLVAPSETEKEVEPELATLAEATTLEAFQRAVTDWRQDASTSRDSLTFFYFAGHGVQRTRGDATLLLSDFGDGIGATLSKAVNAASIHSGMAPTKSRPDIARTQLYFIDACRSLPTEFKEFEKMETAAVWDLELGGRDDRRAPLYYASIPGAKAYALSGKQTVFSTALLDCLQGGAGDLLRSNGTEYWAVSSLTLVEKLEEYVTATNRKTGADQEFIGSGFGGDFIIHWLDGPPLVEVTVEVDPHDALDYAKLEILDDAGVPTKVLPKPLDPHPYLCQIPAGIYTLRVRIDPPHPPLFDVPGKARPLRPPQANLTAKVY
jgi:hypothetical protein